MLCPRHEPEEVVGIDGRPLVLGRHVVGLAQVIRDKGEVSLLLRHHALFHVEQQQVIEVEHTGLQHTHHLNIRYRLAVERQGDAAQEMHQQVTQQRQGGDCLSQERVRGELAEAVDGAAQLINRLAQQERMPIGSPSIMPLKTL